MAEQTFYDQNGVQITNARFIVGNATYQLSQINQVMTFQIPAKKAGPVWMIILGSIAILIGLGFILTSIGALITFEIIGLGMIVGAIFMLIYGFKPTYAARITTSSGQRNAVLDKNKSYIDVIVKALNDAMASKV